MSIDEWINMMDAKEYGDGEPVVIGTDTPYVYTTTYGEFKRDWVKYRIY